MAADRELRKELLAVGPWCMDVDEHVSYCSPNATRTLRSGVADVEYMIRPDREFWSVGLKPHTRARAKAHQPTPCARSEFKFARQRLTPEVDSDIEMCRSNLTARVAKCHLSCDSCNAECTSSAARSLVSSYRCSLGMPTVGLTAAFHSSDVGHVSKPHPLPF